MSHSPAWMIIPALIAPLTSGPAYATQYMTAETARKLMFPEASTFNSQPVRLNDEQKRVVEQAAKVRRRHPEQPVWQVLAKGKPIASPCPLAENGCTAAPPPPAGP